MTQRNPMRTMFGLAAIVGVAALLFMLAGPAAGVRPQSQPDLVWGRHGIGDGKFQKPRAMAIDPQNHVYVVDMTARVQVFDADGNFLRTWRMPEWERGKPTGISVDRRGRIMVADTHYFRVMFYSPEGKLVWALGGEHGSGPGEFGLVTDVAEDSKGNYYVSEYGEFDRIQKFDAKGNFLLEWGEHGDALGHFARPQSMCIDEQDRVWVADACNHRIQVFDSNGKFQFCLGKLGKAPGELSYPYGLTMDAQGNLLVAEFGNHRVQWLTRDGRSLACWGTGGRSPGQLHCPWSVVCDTLGRVHVLDTKNNRVQRLRL